MCVVELARSARKCVQHWRSIYHYECHWVVRVVLLLVNIRTYCYGKLHASQPGEAYRKTRRTLMSQ